MNCSQNNPNNPSIKPLIEIGLTVLKNSPRLKLALQGISIVYSTRPPANLKQTLTRSKFADKVEGIVSKCGDKRYITCKQLIVGKTFIFKSTNQEFEIKKKYELQYKIPIICFDMHGMRRKLHRRNKSSITGKNDTALAVDQRKRISNTTSECTHRTMCQGQGNEIYRLPFQQNVSRG